MTANNRAPVRQTIPATFAPGHHFRIWHLTDLIGRAADIGCSRQSGHRNGVLRP